MPQVPDSIIQSLKRNTSIVSLLRKYGILTRKKGKSLFAICPFHDVNGQAESEPSLSIDTINNQYHCFSCNAGGDSIKFVMEYEKVTFPQAVEKLLAMRPVLAKALNEEEKEAAKEEKDVSKPDPPAITEEERQSILKEIVERSILELRSRKAAREYLEKRGLDPLALLEQFTIGYWPVDFLEKLHDTDKNKLKSLGLISDTHALFSNCILFPLYKEGRITTLYGRKVCEDSGDNGRPIGTAQGRHYMLPCKREGLYLPSADLNPQKPVIITESIIDSLSFFAAGITNSLPLLGVVFF